MKSILRIVDDQFMSIVSASIYNPTKSAVFNFIVWMIVLMPIVVIVSTLVGSTFGIGWEYVEIVLSVLIGLVALYTLIDVHVIDAPKCISTLLYLNPVMFNSIVFFLLATFHVANGGDFEVLGDISKSVVIGFILMNVVMYGLMAYMSKTGMMMTIDDIRARIDAREPPHVAKDVNAKLDRIELLTHMTEFDSVFHAILTILAVVVPFAVIFGYIHLFYGLLMIAGVIIVQYGGFLMLWITLLYSLKSKRSITFMFGFMGIYLGVIGLSVL